MQYTSRSKDESACLNLVFPLNSFVRSNSWNLIEKIGPKMLKSHITFLPSASAKALKRQEEIKKIAIMAGVTNKELLLDDACLPFLFLPEQWKLKSVHTLYKEYLGWLTLLLKRNVLQQRLVVSVFYCSWWSVFVAVKSLFAKHSVSGS